MPLCRLIFNAKALTSISLCGRRCLRTRAGTDQHAIEDVNPADEAEPRRAASKRHPRLARAAAASLPSEQLIKAFRAKGLRHLIYKPPVHNANLSLVNTAKHDPVAWRAELRRNETSSSEDDSEQPIRSQMTPATIAARAIAPTELSGSKYLQVLGPQLSSKERGYLMRRGYYESDVTIWAKVLTTENPDKAASILRFGEGHGAQQFMDKPIPAFLPLTLLRRPHLGPMALRDIIIRLWSELRRRERMPHGRSTLDSSTMFVLIVRLLRRARDSWPMALVTVTQMFLKYFTLVKEASPTYAQKLKRHNLLHNRMLRLLALPTRSTPFHAVPHHQRAQFDVIAAMATHDPPLIVSREGFQAIASVQAAHQKTPQEQDWSQLKAKSWPPWKQDKTGMDAEKGFNYGSTRAMQVVRRAAEAGYARESYERTAQILAGWDTDRSPTIQTRSHQLHEFLSMPRLPPADNSSHRRQLDVSSDNFVSSPIWAARVEATRTVREAWACFLSYQDQRLAESRKSDRSLVYNAILRKLLVNRVDVNSDEEELEFVRRPLEPGDHQEVLPEPISPKELTWLHTDPPFASQLVGEMLTFKVPFEASSIALLLDKARSLEHGLRRLHYFSPQIPSLDALHDPRVFEASALAKVPSQVFIAYLRLLVRFPSTAIVEDAQSLLKDAKSPFQQAVQLILKHPSPERIHLRILLIILQARSSWLSGIDVEPRGPEGTPGSFIKRINFWQDFTRRFQSDSRRTHSITNIDLLAIDLYEKAVVAALTLQDQRRFDPTAVDDSIPQDQVRDILENTADTMKNAFYRAAEGPAGIRDEVLSPSQQPPAMPTLLETPSPVTIHTMVRLLGFLTDYRGIIDLFTWIAKHEAIIRAAAEQPRSGLAIIRRAVVAARVCFDRAWVDRGAEELEASSLAAPEEMREELFRVVEGTKLFGEWPKDEEVWRYVEKGRGTFPVGNE